jgi:DNA-binding transcriptional LysR family regulator
VVTGNAPEIVTGVIRSELDVGLVTLPVSEHRLDVTLFCTDPLVAITPPERAWRRRGAITAAELAAHPLILYERGGLIRRVIEEWFRKSGVRPRVAMELGNAEALKELVGAGLGLSISSAITVAADVRRGTLLALPLSPPLERRIGIVRRRGNARSEALDVVLAALASYKRRRGPRSRPPSRT